MSYVNPSSVLGISIFFPLLCAIVIAARFYVRRSRNIPLGTDDWLCVPAWILVTGSAASLIVGVAGHAIGYDSAPADNAGNNPTIIFLEKCEFAFNLMAPLALGCIKLSILFFYRRVFVGKLFKVLNWSLITVVIVWTLAFFLVQVLDCKADIAINWGLLSDLQKCINTLHQLLALSITDVIVDLFIFVSPIPLIWMLHMPTTRKLAVIGIFLIGLVAIITGILRLIVFVEVFGAGHTQKILVILGVTVLDDMAVVSLFLFWPMVQMGVALTAACLPTLRPLFQGLSPESVLNSVRSKLSLQSMRTDRPNSDGPKGDESSFKDSVDGVDHEFTLSQNSAEPYPLTSLQTRREPYDQLAAGKMRARQEV